VVETNFQEVLSAAFDVFYGEFFFNMGMGKGKTEHLECGIIMQVHQTLQNLLYLAVKISLPMFAHVIHVCVPYLLNPCISSVVLLNE
jgi:hypothetical protein